MRAPLVWRSRLSSRPGTLLQIVVIARGAIALPGGSLLSPALLAGVAAALIWISGDDWRSVGFIVGSIVFGLGSLYQGAAGVVVGALTGAILNGLCYWARRNVWPSVLAHGVFNLAALTLLYLGTI